MQLLILTNPNPCIFHGKVGPKIQNMTTITLHSGKSKEDRTFERFPIDSMGTIEEIVRDNITISLPPTKAKLINISQGGMRFSSTYGLLNEKDKVFLRIEVNKSEQVLIAEVVNFLNVLSRHSEYGCRFLDTNT